MCKEDVNFEVWWLVLVENRGQFPSILLDRSTIMLEFPVPWPVLDGILAPTDLVW
jgi:hypothetical protein